MINKGLLSVSAIVLVLSTFLLSACSIPFVNTQAAPTPTPISYYSYQTPTPRPSGYLYTTPTKAPNSSATSFSKTGTDTTVSMNTKYGQIVFKLYTKEAPKSSQNFIDKIKSGFYDNLTFHRVEPGYVVQGGDPKGDSTGGGSIPSELNNIAFKRASLGLARGPDRSYSNDSQFFICLTDANCASLTGDYVNFGEVIYGMDVVDKIKVGDKILSASADTK